MIALQEALVNDSVGQECMGSALVLTLPRRMFVLCLMPAVYIGCQYNRIRQALCFIMGIGVGSLKNEK